MSDTLKQFIGECFPTSKPDLYAAFVLRALGFGYKRTKCGIVAPYLWMFITSYESFRLELESKGTIRSLVKLEYNAFEPACVPVATFVIEGHRASDYEALYIDLSEFKGAENQSPRTIEAINSKGCDWRYQRSTTQFTNIPGQPLCFWLPRTAFDAFGSCPRIGTRSTARKGMYTGLNEKYVRQWTEVSTGLLGLGLGRASAASSGLRWFPYANGGRFRKWYGNNEDVVLWQDDGRKLRDLVDENGRRRSGAFNLEYICKVGICWSAISSSFFGVRLLPKGFLFSSVSSALFPHDAENTEAFIAVLNSKASSLLINALNPSMHFNAGDVANLPLSPVTISSSKPTTIVTGLVQSYRTDWDAYERSWDFQSLPILTASSEPTPTLESNYTAWITQNRDIIAEMKRLEEENNRLFIDAYGLADELTPDVPIEQITLTVNPAYRYGGKLTEEEQWTRFRQDTMEELVSYATGCIMGRYSLDAPGLTYALSGNEGFDPSRYTVFPADDGIIPLTYADWFDDDACNRLIEFISVAWDEAHLEDNLTFLADNLKPKKNESSRDTIRRYLCDSFPKDHLQTYKKRPIYWLFSSGKQRAFQCLAYLHRYNEGTLARMRTEYVIPLTGKLFSRIEHLDGDIAAAASTSHRRKLEKERDTLVKQRSEIQEFDEKLRHYADKRISRDLDDGVKVNYGKFGDLLAEVKAVTGKKPKLETVTA